MSDKKTSPVKESLKYCFKQITANKKSYFVLSLLDVIFKAAIPFAEIIFLPLLIDSMLQPEKDIHQIIFYGAAMVILQIVTMGADSVLTIQLEKSEDFFMNLESEEISMRCMEIDFSLTENKKALDQIKKARDCLLYTSDAADE